MATTTIEPFVGKWKLKSSKNFDDYMRVLGVNVALRQMGNLAKPDLLISVDGNGVVTMKSMSTMKTIEIKFKLDEEFDESTADGRTTKSLITVTNGKLVQWQRWDGKETMIERELQDGMLITKCTMDDVVSTRIYEKAA